MMAFIILISLFLPAGSAYVSSMVMVYLVIIMMNLFALDDNAKWDRCAIALPLSRRQIVTVRYWFLFGLTVIANTLGILLNIAIAALRGSTPLLLETLLAGGGLGLTFLFIASISMPLCYRYGAEKARMAMMVAFIIPFLGFIWGLPVIEPLLKNLSHSGIAFISFGITVLIMSIYVGSWGLSAHIYKKKEF